MDKDNKLSQPYQDLSPDVVLAAVESRGRACNGSILALNSYENRVYQVGIEEGGFLITKFYRPERWSDDTILEEHAFALELEANEIPVVAPLRADDQATLFQYQNYRFSLSPRKGGRTPELTNPETLVSLGRFIARLHAVGATHSFQHRPVLTIKRFAIEPSQYLLAQDFIPVELIPAYSSLINDLIPRIQAAFERAGNVKTLRLHGDCHPGNLLWTDDGVHFVDLDDCLTGPAVQDIWMLLSGSRSDMTQQLGDFLDGYYEFYDFDPRELHLLEALRTLRMIHYSAWLARRWQDPAFPQNFPWFDTPRYWDDQILSLREQAALLDEEPLSVVR